MAGQIHYKLGLDAAPLVKGFAAARNALGGFTSGLAKVGGLVSGLTGLGAAGTIIGGFVKSLTGAAEMETTTVAFETLIGSASEAAATLEGLKKFGAETPFEFPELADAGKKLLAFGSGAGNVVNELRTLGDLSAGIGAPIGELAELYGKARTQGRLMAEDVNQLTGRGIPVIAEFAKQFGVSTSEVRGLIEEGKIGFPQLKTALASLTSEGGRFFDMTKKQSQTAAGLWSTLKDNIGEVLREFGKPILTELKAFLKDGIAATGGLVDKAREFGKEVGTALAVARELYQQGKLGDALGAGLKLAFASAANLLISAMKIAVQGFAAGMVVAVKAAFAGGNIDEAVANAGKAFSGTAKLFDVDAAKRDFMSIVAPAAIAVKLRQALEAATPKVEAPRVQLQSSEDSFTGPAKKDGGNKVSAGSALAAVGLYVGGGTPKGERHAQDTAKNTKQANGLLGEINRNLARQRGGTF
jgi:tape measure domain-containing protein